MQIINEHVLSLPLAKKLLELNFKKDSLFSWLPKECVPGKASLAMKGGFNETYHHDSIPAYLASEIMSLVPACIDIKKSEPFNHYRFDMQLPMLYVDDELKLCYSANYHCDTMQLDTGSPFFALRLFKHTIYDPKLPDALAKLLINIIENNYVQF